MSEGDRIRVQHMLDAASEALSFAKVRSLQDLQRDRILLLALVKEIEIIGEAANQVSEELRKGSNAVPWERIRGMRNRLIHAYADVNVEIVMNTVRSDLPTLVQSLKELLTAEKS